MPMSMSGRGQTPGASSMRQPMETTQSVRNYQLNKIQDGEGNEVTEDTAILTCFGDADEILQYNLGRFTWEKSKFENQNSVGTKK